MTEWNDFKGEAQRLTDTDLPREAAQMGVGEDILHGFIDCESQGKGYDEQGRPLILFEPHVLYRNLSGKQRQAAVDLGLAYPKQGTKPYGKESEQYPKLLAAMKIDETAALKACSVGMFQVLMENHKMVNFVTPQAMMLAMMESEANQLQAAVDFIKAAGIDDDLRRLDAILKQRPVTAEECQPAVRVYNGPAYKKNAYDTKMAKSLNKWRGIKDTPWTPTADANLPAANATAVPPVFDTTKNVQQRLDDLGYHEVGTVDGKWGQKTETAVLAFRNDNGLPLVPQVDDQFLAKLMSASSRTVSTARANATIETLKKAADAGETGAKDVKVLDLQQKITTSLGGLGGLGVAAKTIDELGKYSDLVAKAASYIDPVKDVIVNNIGVILIGVGGFCAWQAYKVLQIRLEKHRTAQDVSV